MTRSDPLSRLLGRELISIRPDHFSELSDVPGQQGTSPRLEAVLALLPRFYGTRAYCALLNANICTVDKLCTTAPRDLARVKNLGAKSIAEIGAALSTFGFRLYTVLQPNDTRQLSDLSDDPSKADPYGPSPRLAAVLDRLPKQDRRKRIENALLNANIRTVSKLCSAPLHRGGYSAISMKTAAEITHALAVFGLSVVDQPKETRDNTTKPQSAAQRVANSAWLRSQLQELVEHWDTHVEKACRQAEGAYWKAQLERILSGRTAEEDRKYEGEGAG